MWQCSTRHRRASHPAPARCARAMGGLALLLWLALLLPAHLHAAEADGQMVSAAATPSAGMARFEPYSVPETHMVRVALLNTAEGLDGALQLNLLLSRYRRQSLEARMGLKLEVVNISNANADHIQQSVLYYRPGFLRPALILAEVMPGEQAVEPMPPQALAKQTVDIQILVGKELP